MIRIIYDARWIPTNDKFDGIGRYSTELAKELAKKPNIDLIWLIHNKKQLEKLPKKQYIIANKPQNAIAELFLAHKLNKFNPDIVYSPFFMMGSLGKKYKLILTIHDLIYFHHKTPPHWLAPHIRLGWRIYYSSKWPMRYTLNRADAIATVSDTAKNEIINWNMTKKSVTTIPNAVSEQFKCTRDKNLHFKSNDILYMGAFTQYKNVELLINALTFLPEINLHLLSRIPESRKNELSQLAQDLKVSKRVITHNGVSDSEYKDLLSNCRCLVTASRLEGFGLPIIEAQLNGTPVACSNIPIFKEVAGDSAIFFNANNARDCANAIENLSDKSVNEKIIKLGYENASRYSWKNSADKAIELCSTICATNSNRL